MAALGGQNKNGEMSENKQLAIKRLVRLLKSGFGALVAEHFK